MYATGQQELGRLPENHTRRSLLDRSVCQSQSDLRRESQEHLHPRPWHDQRKRESFSMEKIWQPPLCNPAGELPGRLVEGIRLEDSAMWMQHYLACDRVNLRGITVFNFASYNNDGVDIDSCRDVCISIAASKATTTALRSRARWTALAKMWSSPTARRPAMQRDQGGHGIARWVQEHHDLELHGPLRPAIKSPIWLSARSSRNRSGDCRRRTSRPRVQ